MTSISDEWDEFLVQGVAPANAVYMVPSIEFSGRVDGNAADDVGVWAIGSAFDLCGAQVYLIDTGGSVSITPPDKYLTLGATSEKLGEYSDSYPTTSGFLLGEP